MHCVINDKKYHFKSAFDTKTGAYVRTGSSGENDFLWDEYRDYISEYYEDEDALDSAMEDAVDSNEWVSKTSTYDFKKGDAAATCNVSMSGPAD